MKAIAYFDKYAKQIQESSDEKEVLRNISNLVTDMMLEVKVIATQRKIQRDSALISIFKEQNQKWNALVSLLEKRYGASKIIRNGFSIYAESFLSEFPFLKGELK